MKDKEVLLSVVEYCLQTKDIDLDTLNKISETISLAAQKKKGKLTPSQEAIFNIALEDWSKANPTPREFKGIFRGAK